MGVLPWQESERTVDSKRVYSRQDSECTAGSEGVYSWSDRERTTDSKFSELCIAVSK